METNLCKWCKNTGVVTVPNGADDYDMDFCSCPEGSIKMQNAELQSALSGLYKKMSI